eukprot:TRINITY_DN27524_c0_g1_i1.p1 TRINITY_DN27524_c0_g1~~TRINITY_DN27524_c0_g1_i1.p1  ORF type:complete len:1762 (+),score=229.37 TRINITY_DN27524_c0_g1_i1:311-5287(+)
MPSALISSTSQPYTQEDIGPDDCIQRANGIVQRVRCQSLPVFWFWGSRSNAVSYDVGSKKMAEMINREQWLLPGYRLEPYSVIVETDAEDTKARFSEVLKHIGGCSEGDWVSFGGADEGDALFAMTALSKSCGTPWLSAGKLSGARDGVQDSLTHWWNYEQGAEAVLRLLWEKGLTHASVWTDQELDPDEKLAANIDSACRKLGVRPMMVVRIPEDPRFHEELFSRVHRSHRSSNVVVAFLKNQKLLQSLLCVVFKERRGEMLFILPHDKDDGFYKGNASESHRLGCSDEDLLSIGDFIRVDKPFGLQEEIDVENNMILDCFDPLASIDWARSRNGTAKSFMAQMHADVPLNAGAQWSAVDAGHRLPGVSADLMCHVGLMLREILQQNQTLMLSATSFGSRLAVLTNLSFTGTLGRVFFRNSSHRLWDTDISLLQSRTFRKAASFSPSLNVSRFDPGFVPLWKSNESGWENIPPSLAPQCSYGKLLVRNKCEYCAAGTEISSSGHACDLCEIGHSSNISTQCIKCKPGRYAAERGSSECMLCPAGFSADSDGNHECTACSSGTWTETTGNTQCKSCPPGRYSATVGAYSCHTCEDSDNDAVLFQYRATCLCPFNTYHSGWPAYSSAFRDANGFSTSCNITLEEEYNFSIENIATVEVRSVDKCAPCSEGFDCPGSSSFRGCDVPILKKGYMMFPPLQIGQEIPAKLQAWRCKDDGSCPGSNNLWNESSFCANGRTGFACGFCPAGTWMDARKACSLCRHDASPFAVIPVIVFFLPLFVFWLYRRLNKWNSPDDSMKSTKLPVGATCGEIIAQFNVEAMYVINKTLRIQFTFMQTLGLIGATAPNAMPGWLRFAFRVFEVMNLDLAFVTGITDFFRIGCVLQQNFLATFIVTMVMPLAFASVFFYNLFMFNMLISKVQTRLEGTTFVGVYKCLNIPLRKFLNARIDFDLTINSIGAQTTALYISLVSLSTSPWVTYSHPGNKVHSLVRFPGISTKDPRWFHALPFAIMGVLLYCVAFFAGCLWVCAVAPANYHVQVFRKRYFFIINGFRPEVWWWSIIILIKSITINFVIILSPNMVVMAVSLSFVFMIFLVLNFIKNPWPNWSQNLCETCCNVSISILLPCLALRPAASTSVATDSLLAATLQMCILCPPMVTAGCVFTPLWRFGTRNLQAVRQLRMVQRFRNLMYLILTFTNLELNQRFQELDDVDRQALGKAMSVISSVFLRKQPGTRLSVQRLIKAPPDVATDARILQLIGNAMNEKRDVLEVFYERYEVQYFIDQLSKKVNKKERKRQSLIHAAASDAKQFVKRNIGSDGLSAIWQHLCGDSATSISKRDFINRSVDLAPHIPMGLAEKVFTVIDTDGTEDLDRDEFRRVFNGLVVSPWDTTRANEHRELRRFCLGLGRHNFCPASILVARLTQFQRLVRERTARKRALLQETSDAAQDTDVGGLFPETKTVGRDSFGVPPRCFGVSPRSAHSVADATVLSETSVAPLAALRKDMAPTFEPEKGGSLHQQQPTSDAVSSSLENKAPSVPSVSVVWPANDPFLMSGKIASSSARPKIVSSDASGAQEPSNVSVQSTPWLNKIRQAPLASSADLQMDAMSASAQVEYILRNSVVQTLEARRSGQTSGQVSNEEESESSRGASDVSAVSSWTPPREP